MPILIRLALVAALSLLYAASAAAQCALSISPNSQSVPASGFDGQIVITGPSGCARTAVSNVAWITVTFGQSGSGNGTAGYNVQANNTNQQRQGTLTVAGQTFTVTQAAGSGTQTPTCTFTPSIPSIPGTGGNVNVQIQASSNSCDRTVTSLVPWISVSSGGTGTGSGTVVLSVQPNTSAQPRTGSIQINDASFTVFQLGNTCQILINPTTGTAGQTGGIGTIAVSAGSGCAWTATSQAGWIQITSGASGTGTGTVSYSAGQNLNAETRAGFITVGSATFTLTQAGLGCDVSLDSNSTTVGSEGGQGTVAVRTLNGCAWSAVSSSDWIVITKGNSGSGLGEITFNVQPNPTIQTRTGTIIVGTSVFRVTQAAAQCRVSATLNGGTFGAAGGTGSIAVTANCQWTAAPSAGWLQITSASSGNAAATITFQVQANSSADQRQGNITINGQALTIMQSGQRCSVTLSGQSASLSARGGTGTVNVTGGAACSWTASTGDNWLRVEYASVAGSGTVRFAADPNTTGVVRTATVSVAGQSFTVQQPPIVVTISAEGIQNAASYAGGPVAPGEIVTIYGSGFGPTAITGYALTADKRAIGNLIGDTQVFFDGTPAPLIYAADGQLSAVVPYAVAGKQTAVMQVEYMRVKSNSVMVSITPSAPGIFTNSQNGLGQAAVLNQDSSYNGNGAGFATAARGSVIQIFATGEGQTRPTGTDGKLATVPLPAPVLPVRVFIGGIEVQVLYAGASAGQVAGLVQINARVPDSVIAGPDVPLAIRIGDAESKAGPTIAVR